MPYKNIVYVKLEKRLSADHRWYMMSEEAQLNYIRFILLAAETYNRIPKDIAALKLAFKTSQSPETITSTIVEIKKNFKKFKETKGYYHFDEFDEKTNWIAPKESPRNSRVSPKEVTDKEYSIEEKEKKRKEKGDNPIVSHFDQFWLRYPNKKGKGGAMKAFEKIDAEVGILLHAIDSQVSERGKKRELGLFVPEWKHPQTWLNQRCWEDEVKTEEELRKTLPTPKNGLQQRVIATKKPCQWCKNLFDPMEIVGHELNCPKAPQPAAPDSEVVKHALDGIKGLTEGFSVSPVKGERTGR